MRLPELVAQLLDGHRRMLIWIGLLLVANIVLVVVSEQAVLPKLAEKEGRFLQRQSEVRRLLHNQGGTAKSPEKLFVLAGNDLSKFKQVVPAYEEFTGLIEELLVLSSSARLEISRIGYAAEELKSSPLLKFSLNFNVEGEYQQIKKFIHSLEQSSRLITIAQVGLQSSAGTAVNLRLNLETYFRPGSVEP